MYWEKMYCEYNQDENMTFTVVSPFNSKFEFPKFVYLFIQ